MNLDRGVYIHVCKDRTLSYRTKEEPIFNGRALPVFSVASKVEAENLLTLVGRLQHTEHPQMPGKPWRKITLDGDLDLKRELDLEDLPEVIVKLQKAYDRILKAKGQK